jgi:hypothetical protein
MPKKQTKPAEPSVVANPSTSAEVETISPSLGESSKLQSTATGDGPKDRAIDPEELKSEELNGYKIRLQHSRKHNQFQIKFGEGTSNDRPPTAIREFVRAPEGPDGPRFAWNNEDRAWGMTIEENTAAASKIKAERVYAEVIKRVAEDLGIGRSI